MRPGDCGQQREEWKISRNRRRMESGRRRSSAWFARVRIGESTEGGPVKGSSSRSSSRCSQTYTNETRTVGIPNKIRVSIGRRYRHLSLDDE